jgi:hypothetical protein
MKVVFDNGNEYNVGAEALGATIAGVKAQPDQMWLTNGVRYIERAYAKGPTGTYEPVFIVVVEQEPTVRTVKYQKNFHSSSNYHSAQYETAQLSFPYIVNVFVIRTNGDMLYLDKSWPLSFYRTQPLSDFTDGLKVCNLPNVRIDPWNDAANSAAIGWTCYHNAPSNVSSVKAKSGESESSALNRLVEKVLRYYWEASFTGSAGAVTAWKETAKNVKEVKTVEEWAKNSKNNPSFVLTAKWLPHPKNAKLGDVVKSIRTELSLVDTKNPTVNEESPLVCPDSTMSEKRMEAIVKVAAGQHSIGGHLKLF